MLKNEWLNKYSKEERKDKAYNERIEMMDNLIQSDKDFMSYDIIKK